MSTRGSYSAESAVRAVDGVNIALLEKPVFVEGLSYAVLPGERVVIDGLARRVSLRGSGIVDTLDMLRDHCDGSRTLVEVLESVPSDMFHQARRVLALAVIRGLVAEQSVEPESNVSEFLDRFLAETGRYQSGAQAAQVVEEATVAVQAPDAARALVELELESIGVRIADIDSSMNVAVVSDPAELAELDTTKPLIVAVDAGETIAIASVGFASDQPCIDCLRHQLTAVLPRNEQPPRPHQLFFLAAALATETLSLVAGHNQTQIIDRFLVASADHGQQYLLAKRRPDCGTCLGSDARPLHGSAASVFEYEELVAFGSRALATPSAYLGHYQDSNLKLSHRRQPFLTGDRIPIPVAQDDFSPGLAAAFDLAWHGVGVREITDDFVSRHAPTGGNIGSPVAYIGSSDATNWYRVDPVAGEVIARRPMTDEWRDWLEQRAGSPGSCIVLTGDVQTVVTKYGPFGWKIIGLDSGTALASLYGGALLSQQRLIAGEPELDLVSEIGIVGAEVPMACFALEGLK